MRIHTLAFPGYHLDYRKKLFSNAIVTCCFCCGVFSQLAGWLFDLTAGQVSIIMSLFIILIVSAASIILRIPAILKGFKSLEAGIVGLVLSTLLISLIQLLSGLRIDDSKILFQAIQALLPVSLFFVMRDWSARYFSLRSLDIAIALLSLVAVSSVYLEFLGFTAIESYGMRYFGFLGDSVAWILGMTLAYYFLRGNFLASAFLIIALALTQSRSPILIFFLSLALSIYYFFNFGQVTLRISIRSFIFISGFFAFILLAHTLAEAYISTIIDRIADTSLSDSDRAITSLYTLSVFYKDILWGSGFNSHNYYYALSGYDRSNSFGLIETPSSTWLQILSDSGLIGFSMFLLVVIGACGFCFSLKSIKKLLDPKSYKQLSAFACWIVPFILFNQTAAWLIPGSLLSPLFFASLGVVVGAIRGLAHLSLSCRNSLGASAPVRAA